MRRLPLAPEPDPVVVAWLETLDLIQDDIQELLLRRLIFRRLREIVEANPKLHRSSLLYTYLTSTYAASAAAGVRRHARQDDQRRDASLIGLLFDIRRTPEVLTRSRHVAMYEAAGLPARVAEAEFDEIVALGASGLDLQHVQHDIDALRGSTDALERYATQRVAHLDRERTTQSPTFAGLDVALDEFERVVRRYVLLMRGKDDAVLPVIDGAWEAVLMEPWIPPRQQFLPLRGPTA